VEGRRADVRGEGQAHCDQEDTTRGVSRSVGRETKVRPLLPRRLDAAEMARCLPARMKRVEGTNFGERAGWWWCLCSWVVGSGMEAETNAGETGETHPRPGSEQREIRMIAPCIYTC
jgi:hypothetical protein